MYLDNPFLASCFMKFPVFREGDDDFAEDEELPHKPAHKAQIVNEGNGDKDSSDGEENSSENGEEIGNKENQDDPYNLAAYDDEDNDGKYSITFH